jgi:hypothetical protein
MMGSGIALAVSVNKVLTRTGMTKEPGNPTPVGFIIARTTVKVNVLAKGVD